MYRSVACYPSLKIAQTEILQSGSISYLYQRAKLPLFAKFNAFIKICNIATVIGYVEVCYILPQSKKSTKGHFQSVFISFLFQRGKLPLFAKFDPFITVCNIVAVIAYVELWYQLPLSRNSSWGHFSEVIYIKFCKAY